MTISRNLSFLAEGVSSTGVLGATYGGTGQSSITTGDLLYGSASNTISKLAIGSTGTILRVVAGVPSWGTDYTGTVTSVAATVPSFLSISGSPITSSGTLAITYSGTALPTANGGTALTSFTANGVLYASSSSVLATSSSLVFDGTNLGVGGSALSSSAGRTDLTVNGSSSAIISFGISSSRKGYLYQDGTDFNLFNETTTGSIRFGTNSTEKGRFDSSGNFLVGKTSALSSSAGRIDLTINGASSGAIISFGNGGSRVGYLYQDGTNMSLINETATGYLRFGTNGAEVARLFASGGVSIGNTTDPGAGNLRFSTAGTNGIYFGSTSRLDTYETGTWTPVVTAATGSITSYTASGTYTKIGRLVVATFTYNITNNGTGTGLILVTAPFTAGSAALYPTGSAAEVAIAGWGGYCIIAQSTASIGVQQYSGAYAGLTGVIVRGTISYQV